MTPGVILTEAMAQTGVVALGLYLTSLKFGEEGLSAWTTFFTDCQMDYYLPLNFYQNPPFWKLEPACKRVCKIIYEKS